MTHSPSPGCPALINTDFAERLPRLPSEEPAQNTSLRGVGTYSKFGKRSNFPQLIWAWARFVGHEALLSEAWDSLFPRPAEAKFGL